MFLLLTFFFTFEGKRIKSFSSKGLRMSQFRDVEKHSPTDPTQKTLSEFILSGSSLSKAYENQDTSSENSGDFVLLEDKKFCELDVTSDQKHRCIASEVWSQI
jgi:hypothetical protein